MQLDELLTKVSRLSAFRQQEVLDFISFLEQRDAQQTTPDAEHEDWSERQYQAMSVAQAMRGMEEASDLYSEDDLKERWQ